MTLTHETRSWPVFHGFNFTYALINVTCFFRFLKIISDQSLTTLATWVKTAMKCLTFYVRFLSLCFVFPLFCALAQRMGNTAGYRKRKYYVAFLVSLFPVLLQQVLRQQEHDGKVHSCDWRCRVYWITHCCGAYWCWIWCCYNWQLCKRIYWSVFAISFLLFLKISKVTTPKIVI